MHIPDGYLSPASCAGLYAAAAPFWYVALKRVKAKLNTRAVPLLAVFSAFTFVLMMFNLPLPGGTTGHAVGMGMTSIVLGPWMSILAISLALFVQALFFGDGGITAFGANCFNMAIAGSLVAYAVYRIGSAGSGLASIRRIASAGLAGYAGINCAAFLAAIEFGIQPLCFHDAYGAPLYAPYPLSVSIPAMMIGHLTFAGLAEFIISAGMVRYLGRTDPAWLGFSIKNETTSWKGSRRLWIGLALALCLTPLGIVAAGKAWGEWSATDFADVSARQQIAAASRNQSLPLQTPQGLGEMASLWRAPLAGYETSLIRNHSLAYFACALAGVILVVALATIITRLNGLSIPAASLSNPAPRSRGFLEKNLSALLGRLQDALFAEEIARSSGVLQRMDPCVKLLGMAAVIVSAIAIHRLTILLVLLAIGVILAAFSGIAPAVFAKRVWLPVLAFTGLVALPALFLVPGEALARLPLVHWRITFQGLISSASLLLRGEVASTFALLLVLSTPWNHLLRALRSLKIPASVVVVLQMTHRYVFLLLETANNLFEARRARLISRLSAREKRRLAVSTAGVLLDKTLKLGSEVHSAMRARGFRGDVYLLDDPVIRTRDWCLLVAFVAISLLLVWLGR